MMFGGGGGEGSDSRNTSRHNSGNSVDSGTANDLDLHHLATAGAADMPVEIFELLKKERNTANLSTN
jgi:hypothetical protein